jgi:hypothetical protein
MSVGIHVDFVEVLTSDPAHHVLRSSIFYIHLFESRGVGAKDPDTYPDPDSVGSLDPYRDPDSLLGSGSGSRRAKITHKNYKI